MAVLFWQKRVARVAGREVLAPAALALGVLPNVVRFTVTVRITELNDPPDIFYLQGQSIPFDFHWKWNHSLVCVITNWSSPAVCFFEVSTIKLIQEGQVFFWTKNTFASALQQSTVMFWIECCILMRYAPECGIDMFSAVQWRENVETSWIPLDSVGA